MTYVGIICRVVETFNATWRLFTRTPTANLRMSMELKYAQIVVILPQETTTSCDTFEGARKEGESAVEGRVSHKKVASLVKRS